MTWLLKNWKIVVLALLVAGLVWLGHSWGAAGVQAKWDAETIARQAQETKDANALAQAVIDEVKRSNAQAKADTEAAIAASQQRQEERLKAAARAGALEGATRKPGPYTECRLGESERRLLEEAMK